MTTKAVADWLTAIVTTNLGVTCAKGFSAWDRPVTSNNAAIEWQNYEPTYGETVSRTVSGSATTFQVVVMTPNEPALWAMVDSMATMIEAVTEATISNTRHRVRWTAITRAEQQDQTVEALRYAAVTTAQITR